MINNLEEANAEVLRLKKILASKNGEIRNQKTFIEEKEQDIEEIANWIFATLRAFGVKSFDDLDNITKIVMKEMVSIGTQWAFSKHKLKARFSHFDDSERLLKKYTHLMPTE